MIVTKQKSLQDILAALKNKTNIFIIGCGECATACKTGGEEEVKALASELSKHKKNIIGSVIPKAPCVVSQVKRDLSKFRVELEKTDCVLVMACGLGVQAVIKSKRFNGKVVSCCDTLFAGSMTSVGEFFESCSSCGECVLNITGGLCPVTRCPKSLLNGPCGGAKNGKCEVDRNNDCVWILIYERLKELGELDNIKNFIEAKNQRKNLRPGSRSLKKDN
ncbi:MAG: methylenetetrahydrofolate reductase C-terminal domain-containing protein [Candidatus Gygaella obscura]|nr:methylenetetrahydrofolate reductase C-terminal domain-containing protein [Candidatus Gygaella obscura]